MRRRVHDMASLMRSHLLGGHGAMQSGHRRRSDAPARDVQAHAWQRRTRGAAEEGRGGRGFPSTRGTRSREVLGAGFLLSEYIHVTVIKVESEKGGPSHNGFWGVEGGSIKIGKA